jgi:hypothetical protein
MSFQAYLRNIESKTGKSPADFPSLAQQKGFARDGQLAQGVKAGAIVQWLKDDFQLGHGHAWPSWHCCRGLDARRTSRDAGWRYRPAGTPRFT